VQWKLLNGNLQTQKLIDFNFANNSKMDLYIIYIIEFLNLYKNFYFIIIFLKIPIISIGILLINFYYKIFNFKLNQ